MKWRQHRYPDEYYLNKCVAVRAAKLFSGKKIDIVHTNIGAIALLLRLWLLSSFSQRRPWQGCLRDYVLWLSCYRAQKFVIENFSEEVYGEKIMAVYKGMFGYGK